MTIDTTPATAAIITTAVTITDPRFTDWP